MKKNIVLLLCNLVLCASCVKVEDEEFGNVHIGEGNWVQITNYRTKLLPIKQYKNAKSEYVTLLWLDDNRIEGSNPILNKEYDGTPNCPWYLEKDTTFDLKIVFSILPEVFLNYTYGDKNSKMPYGTLLPMDFDKVNEAPDPKDFLYNTNIYYNGTVGDITENQQRIGNVYYWANEESVDTTIGYFAYRNKYIGGKGYMSFYDILTPRTFVFMTQKGNWAKLELQSFYKNAPIKPDENSGEPIYLTLRYYVQKDGSRNLRTKKR